MQCSFSCFFNSLIVIYPYYFWKTPVSLGGLRLEDEWLHDTVSGNGCPDSTSPKIKSENSLPKAVDSVLLIFFPSGSHWCVPLLLEKETNHSSVVLCMPGHQCSDDPEHSAHFGHDVIDPHSYFASDSNLSPSSEFVWMTRYIQKQAALVGTMSFDRHLMDLSHRGCIARIVPSICFWSSRIW